MVESDDVEWEEAEFRETQPGWTEYELGTGELVRLRTVVAKIEVALDPETGEKVILDNGEPLVRISSTNFVEVEDAES